MLTDRAIRLGLLARASSGEEIVIARAGTPAPRLVPLAAHPPRVFGALAGRVWIADDFDTPDDAVAELFETGGPCADALA